MFSKKKTSLRGKRTTDVPQEITEMSIHRTKIFTSPKIPKKLKVKTFLTLMDGNPIITLWGEKKVYCNILPLNTY